MDAEERYLTKREADVLVQANDDAKDAHAEAHAQQHRLEHEALAAALTSTNLQRDQHDLAHDRDHESHEKVHLAGQVAIDKALDAVARERVIHAEAHEREHAAHLREHELDKLAITKAEQANDIRFRAGNAFREQLDIIVRTLSTKDSLDAHIKHHDQRLDELRTAIVTLEKSDVKGEGKQLGQGAVIAAIVGAVAFASTVLGIIIVIVNVATSRP